MPVERTRARKANPAWAGDYHGRCCRDGPVRHPDPLAQAARVYLPRRKVRRSLCSSVPLFLRPSQIKSCGADPPMSVYGIMWTQRMPEGGCQPSFDRATPTAGIHIRGTEEHRDGEILWRSPSQKQTCRTGLAFYPHPCATQRGRSERYGTGSRKSTRHTGRTKGGCNHAITPHVWCKARSETNGCNPPNRRSRLRNAASAAARSPDPKSGHKHSVKCNSA